MSDRDVLAEALARAAGWSSVAAMVETCGFPWWFHNKADVLVRELHSVGYALVRSEPVGDTDEKENRDA